jgi:hypothetical protein
MSKRLILPVLFLFFLSLSPVVAETQVLISASRNVVLIGDVISLKIVVKTDLPAQGVRVKVAGKDFEVVSQAELPLQKHDNELVFEHDIDIAYFRTGEFEIGPFPIEVVSGEEVLETKETNSIPITVKSVLSEEDKDIVDLKPPFEVKGNPFFVLKYVAIFLAALLLALLLVVYLKKRKQKEKVAAEPLLSPVEELDKRVKELVGKHLPEKDMFKEFFLRLTEIYKHFLHRQYRFNAEDLTTYETLLFLDSREKEREVTDAVGYVLNTSDLVKFAKFIPTHEVMEELKGKISILVKALRRREMAEAIPTKKNHVTPGK